VKASDAAEQQELLRTLERVGRQHASPGDEALILRAHASGLALWRCRLAFAQGAMAGRDPARALAVIEQCSEADRDRAPLVHVRVQALIELGRAEDARRTAERHLLSWPDDGVVRRLHARVRPDRERCRSALPLVSLPRAMRLARLGRIEPALRMFRVLAWECPDEPKLRVAIRKLEARVERARVATEGEPSTPGPLAMGKPGVGP
jgi:hypothetical protein